MRARIGIDTMPSAKISTNSRWIDDGGCWLPDLSIAVVANTVTSDSASTNCGIASNTLKNVERAPSTPRR